LKRAGESYIVAYRYSQALGAMMASFTTETSAFQGLEFYRRWLMAFIVIVILVILMFSYILYVIVHRPLKKLCDAFGEIAGGRLDISIEHKASDEFQYIYRQFNDTVQTINRLIRQTYEQKILAQEAELKQLQSKINPHFLYNTFFSISTMAKAEGGDMTFELASKTGKYFRYVMKSGSERVTLENELEYARLYAEIQQIRFSSRLDIIIDPPPSTDALLPAFCIQPLIENAIEHGLAQKACGGVIHVGFLEKPDGLAIFVEDNGGGVTEESISRITGTLAKSDEALSNISRRLEICFGRPDCLRLFVGKENGLRVEVFIPKK
ncbi:MAG: histidine kinase, partial [Clostridiales bacterium]|nr:histidine kinase [Clostridiales bacterium]